jgi:hypothetical protein
MATMVRGRWPAGRLSWPQGREVLHPQLVHFLENRSYAKALMFLGGASDIPVGVCGGRAGSRCHEQRRIPTDGGQEPGAESVCGLSAAGVADPRSGDSGSGAG